MVRTTAAATIFQAGTKDNVLPTQARAALNFRILPADSIRTVIEHVTRVVDDDRIEITVAGRFSTEPSRASPVDSDAFRILERTIRSVVSHAVVAPYLVVVVTDARHYADLSENVFRFLPLRLNSDGLKRMHGINERVEVRDYEAAVRTYRQLLINATGQ
jgi:carboxypeptidase PM20D1